MSGTRLIRLLVVTDHETVRSSLAIITDIFDDIEIVGEATNGDEALRLCADLRPDVVLLDLNIPRIDGLTVARLIRQLYKEVGVVVLTYSNATEDIAAAIEAGVSSYVVKDMSISDLASSIQVAVQAASDTA